MIRKKKCLNLLQIQAQIFIELERNILYRANINRAKKLTFSIVNPVFHILFILYKTFSEEANLKKNQL